MAYPATTAPTVSKDRELSVTSSVDKLKENDYPQCNLVTEDAGVNKDKELKNHLDLYEKSLSFQLSQEALESGLTKAVQNKDLLKVQPLVYSWPLPARNFKDKDEYTTLLLSHKANINLKNKDGYSVLIKALETCNFDAFILLVNAGANIDDINSSRPSVFHLCRNMDNMLGMSNIIHLIKQEASIINMIKYPPMTAVCSGNVEELLDCHFIDVNMSNDKETFWKKLYGADVSNANLDILKVLWKGKYTDSNWSTAWDDFIVADRAIRSVVLQLLSEYQSSDHWAYKTALIIASVLGHLEVMEILLNHDSCVKVRNAMKLNALYIALKFKDVDYANFLLNNEVDLDVLTAAINKSKQNEDPATTALTVSKDAEVPVASDVDKLKDNDGPQCNLVTEGTVARINKDHELIRAASVGNVNELKNILNLCQNNLSFQLSQEAMESSLIQAVRRGEEVMVRLLVYTRAQPVSNFKNKDGYTALLVAAENGFTDIARLLLKKGANVNAINNNKDSALLLSVKPSGSTELVRLLLTHNANVNLQNKDGSTALKKALEARDIDTFILLVDAGAMDHTIKSCRNSVIKSCYTIDNILGINYIMSLIREKASSDDMIKHLSEKTPSCNMIKHMSTRLLISVYSGNIKGVRHILDNQLTVYRSKENGTAWMKLVKSLCRAEISDAKLEILKLLLQNETVTDSHWSRGSSALWLATTTNKPSMVRLLCEYNVGLNNPGAYKAALMLALELDHLEVLEILLDHDACVNVRNAIKLNALHISLKFGDVDYSKLLLSRETSLYLSNTIDVNKYNLLHLAATAGLDDTVNILIDMGADVNRVGNDGTTPLEAALKCRAGETLIRCLIKNGACVNASSDFIPLHLSVLYSVEITRLLLDSGADVNARENVHDNTVLIVACGKRLNIEIIKLLLARGAQTNLQNKMGWTALHKATHQANVDLVKLLVESGADLEAQTLKNETAYLLAAGNGNMNVIKALRDLGANISAVDSEGYNALMFAIGDPTRPIKNVEPSTLLDLPDIEAQVNHKCNKGFTALMLVAKAGNVELLRTLLALGADVNITTSVKGKETTVLSVLLEESAYYSTEVMKELIKNGAVDCLPRRCNDLLHRMIMMGRREMVQLLLTNGMAPTVSRIQKQKWQFISIEASPLNVALVSGDIEVAEYLAENMALCPCDLISLSHYNLRDYLDTCGMFKSVNFVEKFCGQPASLLQLSFVTVSHLIGSVPGRDKRVNCLPLPNIIKDKLMFKKTVQKDALKNKAHLSSDCYTTDDDEYDDEYDVDDSDIFID